MTLELERPIEMEEIRKAIFEAEGCNSLGLDGLGKI
jgi:hypothetical protein